MQLTIRNLDYRYPSQKNSALSGISFSIETGSYWCLAGPNGSGKSTLLRLACGFLPSKDLSGEISWNSKPVQQWTRLELARHIAFVPGFLKTTFSISVLNFVLQARYPWTDYWSRPTHEDYSIARSAIDKVGIAGFENTSLASLSLGELQLVLIARAIAQTPKVLLFDEATANLDIKYQQKVFMLLNALKNEGMTILVVSHDLNLAAEFCSNVIWLHQGSVYSAGSFEETLTTKLIADIYGVDDEDISIGKNPHSHKPKLFWRR
ncbi:MAG: ABC transporter ATP-binding protein [Bdellovibrionota bacterium]